MIDTNPETPSRTPALRPVGWPAVMLPAAIVAAAGWLIADPVLGVHLRTGSVESSRPVGIVAAIAVALLAAAAGLGLRVLLRTAQNPDKVWTIVAIAVLTVSLLGPLGATTTASRVALLCLHIAVGAAVIISVRRMYRRR